MDREKTIIIAPNEDGLGTSAWVVRLVKELACQGLGWISSIRVVVASERLHTFHKDKYRELAIPVDVIKLEGVTKRIEMVKRAGALDIPNTVEHALLPYQESAAEYAHALGRQQVLEDADLVIDLSVPQLVKAVHSENVLRARRANRPIASVTVSDHAWSLSLRQIAWGTPLATATKGRALDATISIENDEALTQQAIVFSEPISSQIYFRHWKKLLGHSPLVIPGSLGGPLTTLEYAGDVGAARLRSEVEATGQCPQESYGTARQYARSLLGIENELPTLFISGAGTPVWDEVLGNMIDSYENAEPGYNVVIHNLVESRRRKVKFRGPEGVEIGRHGKMLTFLGGVFGDTHHVLFPAFDLVLARAGGGTVNDALACAVPLILVEEPGMWQVEQIRQSCLRMGLAEGVALSEFQEHHRACVEVRDGRLKMLQDQREQILQIKNHSEIWLAQQLLRIAKGQ